MSNTHEGSINGTPKQYRAPLNISLPYIYNWNSYDGLPVSTTDRLTWNSFPAGESTAFLLSAASRQEINNPKPINGQPTPRPADIDGNPVEMTIISSKNSHLPFDIGVSLVPQNTGPTPHVHWSENEWFYMLSGSVTLYVDHSLVADYAIPGVNGAPLADHLYEIKLEAGQMIYGPSNMIHSFTNYSSEPVTWLTIWQREQEELEGGISQFFTRGDIAPLVRDYDASLEYYKNSDFLERVTHWAEIFPDYNVTISGNFGSYTTSGQYDPDHPNQPGENNPNVIKGAPQSLLDANNDLILNALFQGVDALQTSLVQNRKTTSIRSIGGEDGLPINLELAINSDSDRQESYGYFLVDNRNGTIDGVQPGSRNYLKKVKERLVDLYSNVQDSEHEPDEGVKTISVETGDTLGFFKRDSRGALTLSTQAPHAFNLINAAGSHQTLEGVTVNSRLNGAIANLNSIISGHNDDTSHPLLDTVPLEKREDPVYAKFKVEAKEPERYTVGYYRVQNATGDVLDPDGKVVSPGDSGYARAALSDNNIAADLNQLLTSALKGSTEETGTFNAGALYAPFVTVQKSGGDSSTFFAYNKANPYNAVHIASTGSNTFGFRASKGSEHFNDLNVSGSFALDEQDHVHDCHDHSDQVIDIQNYGLSAGSLVFYRVDPLTGAVNGLSPGDQGYRQAAYNWGKRHNLVLSADELPEINTAMSYDNLGLNPDHSYGMLYVKPKGKNSAEMVSSYAEANRGGHQAFAAYGSDHCITTYGLESGVIKKRGNEAAFSDLMISSTMDNISVWA